MRNRLGSFLFESIQIDERFEWNLEDAERAVSEISETQFLASTDDEVLEYVLAEFCVVPLILHEDRATLEQEEVDVDVAVIGEWDDPREVKPIWAPGIGITIKIPFSGTRWLWDHHPRCYPVGYAHLPVGMITLSGLQDGLLTIDFGLPKQSPPDAYKDFIDPELEWIRNYISSINGSAAEYSNSLQARTKNAIVERRKSLLPRSKIAAALRIQLRQKVGVPDLDPVAVVTNRSSSSELPKLPEATDDPSIENSVYEKILRVIRHEGRTFETTPTTFYKFKEDELRDIVLAHLNGHFEGKAAGEVFRRKGKTDIRIESESRSAFVAECKIWSGHRSVQKALDQLLSYLTWRDSKAALIIFNKHTRSFTPLPAQLAASVRNHRFFIKEQAMSEKGEIRALMRTAEDARHRIMVHAFVFNLHFATAKRSQ